MVDARRLPDPDAGVHAAAWHRRTNENGTAQAVPSGVTTTGWRSIVPAVAAATIVAVIPVVAVVTVVTAVAVAAVMAIAVVAGVVVMPLDLALAVLVALHPGVAWAVAV